MLETSIAQAVEVCLEDRRGTALWERAAAEAAPMDKKEGDGTLGFGILGADGKVRSQAFRPPGHSTLAKAQQEEKSVAHKSVFMV